MESACKNIQYSQGPIKGIIAAHLKPLIVDELPPQPCMEMQALLPESLH